MEVEPNTSILNKYTYAITVSVHLFLGQTDNIVVSNW